MAVQWKGPAVAREVRRRAGRIVDRRGQRLAELYAEEVAVDTGALQASAYSYTDLVELVATVVAGDELRTNYAFFQEFGTVNHPPNPAMRRSLDRLAGEIRAGSV